MAFIYMPYLIKNKDYMKVLVEKIFGLGGRSSFFHTEDGRYLSTGCELIWPKNVFPDEDGNPTDATTITQDHLDEIGLGVGGEGLTTEDVGSGDDGEYGGKGYAQRTKGYNPFLKIKKESKGKKGKFTRGSLRVRKPRRMAV